MTTLSIAVRRYRECLQVDRPPWVRALDDDEIHNMARITGIVLYLANLYIHIRIRHFRQVLDPPCAEWGVSPTERRRIAQALLLFGVLASLHGSELAFLAEEIAIHFFTCMVDLFESWELEQVTEMGHFMVRLVCFFQPLDKHPPCCDNALPLLRALHPELGRVWQQIDRGPGVGRRAPGIAAGRSRVVQRQDCRRRVVACQGTRRKPRMAVASTGPLTDSLGTAAPEAIGRRRGSAAQFRC